MGNLTRLQILDSIEAGVSNPGEIAMSIGRYRSAVEKHLQVLLEAGVVEKVPALGVSGSLTIRYRILEGPKQLLGVARRTDLRSKGKETRRE